MRQMTVFCVQHGMAKVDGKKVDEKDQGREEFGRCVAGKLAET